MNQDTESFEQLRRLLALKRHEQPPPGYYEDFSCQVILRIKAGERGEPYNIIERLFEVVPWMQRIWAALEAKPILAGAAGVALCSLLFAGVLYSDKVEVPSIALVPSVALVPEMDTASTPATFANVSAADHPLLAQPVALEPSSTAPTITPSQTDEFLLRGIANLQAKPATWSFPAGN
jgi:hypothetical protein